MRFAYLVLFAASCCPGPPPPVPAPITVVETPEATPPPGAAPPEEPHQNEPPPLAPPVEPQTGERPDGAACDVAEECASGVCEGEGCDPGRGACVPRSRMCTRDLRAYCGCDGKTFQASGTCPGKRFSTRAPCKGDKYGF